MLEMRSWKDMAGKLLTGYTKLPMMAVQIKLPSSAWPALVDMSDHRHLLDWRISTYPPRCIDAIATPLSSSNV